MRAAEVGFSDWAERIIACGEEYRRKVERGEVEPPKRDADGNIIPSPSTRRPNVFDGLNLTQDTPAEIA